MELRFFIADNTNGDFYTVVPTSMGLNIHGNERTDVKLVVRQAAEQEFRAHPNLIMAIVSAWDGSITCRISQ